MSDYWRKEMLLRYWNKYIEHCGIILKNGDVIELPNRIDDVAKDGLSSAEQNEFAICLEDVLEEARLDEIDGIWHTHPNNSTKPSETDIAGWPRGIRYFIVTQNVVSEWSCDDDGNVTLVSEVSGQTLAGRVR